MCGSRYIGSILTYKGTLIVFLPFPCLGEIIAVYHINSKQIVS